MGNPDKVTYTIDPHSIASPSIAMMPGPVVPENTSSTTTSQHEMYLIYTWRGMHDYLWFQVDPKNEQVIKSGWYMAGE